ncbi:hypothetical protein K1W54_26815 [Micromonospora sp. CPCC 205371]|nr:hypothetical protein [Micromonospora sp. CPCC 205371]
MMRSGRYQRASARRPSAISAPNTPSPPAAMNSAKTSRPGHTSTAGRPAPATLRTAAPLLATSTSWPAARTAHASGTVGSTKAAPGADMNSTFIAIPPLSEGGAHL